MSEVKVSLPEALREWVDQRVRDGGYASPSEYLRDLVSRDRAEIIPELSLEDLRSMIAASRASGPGHSSLEELVAAGDRIARERGLLGE